MSKPKIQRPADDDYYVEPWSDQLMQGDIFADAPFAFAAPPDAVVVVEGERRFMTGPFESGLSMLISPTCAIAAQGSNTGTGTYSHAARALVPIRPLAELEAAGVITEKNVGNLRSDRLQNYMYLPAGPSWPESVALLYLPTTMHHDVIDGTRVAQLTGTAFWHLRVKLMAFVGSFVIYPDQFGSAPSAKERTS